MFAEIATYCSPIPHLQSASLTFVSNPGCISVYRVGGGRMPGRRTILPSAMFALVLIAALSAQATRTTHAADECLAKPTGPTPQGQHWYYRIDHANNNRQCWRLAPEGLPVQKTTPQAEDEAASEPDAQQQSRTPQAVTAAPARAASYAAPATAANPVAIAPSMPWLATPTLPILPQARTVLQTANADDTASVVASDDMPAESNDASTTGSVHSERSQRAATARPLPADAPPQQYAGIERTFILVMVMFALLAVTGPILHFTHRQRQREVIDYKPPRWAPVVALNTPEPRVRAMQTPNPAAAYRPARRAAPQPDQTDWRPVPHRNQNRNPSPIPTPDPRPVPSPARAPDPNERLRHALQQLVDRIQTIQPTQPNAAPGRTRSADIEMLKNAQ
jgi:hypothetical protein